MEFTQDKRETDPLLTSVLNVNWPSGCLFLEHISSRLKEGNLPESTGR